jgi:hypothetical protein
VSDLNKVMTEFGFSRGFSRMNADPRLSAEIRG